MSTKNNESTEEIIQEEAPRTVAPMKKKQRIQLQFDIEYGGVIGATSEEASQTVPDMSLTVRQLLQNHTRGKDGTAMVREPLYFETELPTLNDITDVERYREQLNERLQQADEFIKDDLKKAKEAKVQEAKKQKEQKQRESDYARGKELRLDDEAKKPTD